MTQIIVSNNGGGNGGGGGGGDGDMEKSVYDPTNVNGDAFDYDNFHNTPDLSGYQTTSNLVTNLTSPDDTHYPSAKAVADALSGAGAGDMLKSVYDPNNVSADAFDYDNFINTPTIPTNSDYVDLSTNQTVGGTKTFTTSPVVPSKSTDATNTATAIATEAQVYKKQDTLVSGTNIKTINSNSLLGGGDIALNDVKVSAAAPSSPAEGMVWYDTTNDQLKVYDGTNWNVTVKEYTAGNGINIDANNEISNTGVLSVNGEWGDVSIAKIITGSTYAEIGEKLAAHLNKKGVTPATYTDMGLLGIRDSYLYYYQGFFTVTEGSQYRFIFQSLLTDTTTTNGSYSRTSHKLRRFVLNRDSIESVWSYNSRDTNYIMITSNNYLQTEVDYATPYTPLYDGSPATKKYVDDKKSEISVTLAAANWSSNTITVTATGVTASNTVIVSPAPSSFSAYTSGVVYCSAQASDSLTFSCTTEPVSDLTVNVLILN